MAHSKLIEDRLSNIYDQKSIEVVPKRMFGGVCFLYKGKMTVGVSGEKIVVRILDSKMEEVMSKTFSSSMNFTGKVMKEFAYISEDGFQSDYELEKWVDLGIEHAKTKLKEI